MLALAVSSPVLGAIVDYAGAKKRFLFFFSSLTWLFTGLFFFVQKGDNLMDMTFFILAKIGYQSGQVFYNSLLPVIAEPSKIGQGSGNGWAIGSFRGILCLAIILPLVILIPGTFIVRLSLFFTVLYFMVATLPAVFWIKEKAQSKPLLKGETYLSIASTRLISTAKELGEFREFIRFVISFLVYNDGILMVLNFTSIIGAVLFGIEQQQLIIFMIIVQVTSVAGAHFAGIFGEKIVYKLTLVYSFLLMTAVILTMLFGQTMTLFYIIGAFAGFALTGVQSISRAMVSYFAPPGRSAEFYGFFAVTGCTSSFMGSMIIGLLAAETAFWFERQCYPALMAEQFGQRIAIASIFVFLIAVLLILLKVNDPNEKKLAHD